MNKFSLSAAILGVVLCFMSGLIILAFYGLFILLESEHLHFISYIFMAIATFTFMLSGFVLRK